MSSSLRIDRPYVYKNRYICLMRKFTSVFSGFVFSSKLLILDDLVTKKIIEP